MFLLLLHLPFYREGVLLPVKDSKSPNYSLQGCEYAGFLPGHYPSTLTHTEEAFIQWDKRTVRQFLDEFKTYSLLYFIYCLSVMAFVFQAGTAKMCHSHKVEDRVENYFFTSWTHIFFWRTLNCHISLAVRDVDLIPTLRAQPEYQLSSDIHTFI